MSCQIKSWPGSEHMYLYSRETTTFGREAAYSASAMQSTVAAMLVPQWQVYTPIRIAPLESDMRLLRLFREPLTNDLASGDRAIERERGRIRAQRPTEHLRPGHRHGLPALPVQPGR